MSNSDQSTNQWPKSHTSLNNSELQQLNEKLLPIFKQTLSQEKISFNFSFNDTLKNLYTPISAWLAGQKKDTPLIIGINGSQGSGKSTLTHILSDLLEQGFNKKVISLSIDDLYKTNAERSELAQSVHPLFKTRGVPGTHDAILGLSIIKHLLTKNPSEVRIPIFDKAIDDRLPESEWRGYDGTCDIIIFEGWCVGSIAQEESELLKPVNKLEKLDDPDASWRRYVNQQLAGIYSELYSQIDILLMLKIPDFNKVFEWRKLQEEKLRATLTDKPDKITKTMSDTEINRFIMHYERITRHTLNEMPDRCDIVFELGNDHRVKKVVARCAP